MLFFNDFIPIYSFSYLFITNFEFSFFMNNTYIIYLDVIIITNQRGSSFTILLKFQFKNSTSLKQIDVTKYTLWHVRI